MLRPVPVEEEKGEMGEAPDTTVFHKTTTMTPRSHTGRSQPAVL